MYNQSKAINYKPLLCSFIFVSGNIYLIDVLVATESGDFEIAWSAVMLCCNTISRSRDFVIVRVKSCGDNPYHNSFF